MEELLSLQQVADRYRVKISTVRTWAREGKIVATRVGRSLFFRGVDLIRFEEKCRKAGKK